MSLSPFFKSPFTDFTGAILNHQWHNSCADLELKSLDCLEAYGLDKGVKACQDLLADFHECATRAKQLKRHDIMRAERTRQYWAGERSKEERYAPPPKLDSF